MSALVAGCIDLCIAKKHSLVVSGIVDDVVFAGVVDVVLVVVVVAELVVEVVDVPNTLLSHVSGIATSVAYG